MTLAAVTSKYWDAVRDVHNAGLSDAMRRRAQDELKTIAEANPRLREVIVRDLRIEIAKLQPEVTKRLEKI